MGSISARVVYTDPVNDVEEIKVGTHHLQFGGMGDGFCYAHQDFDCVLTREEEIAVLNAV